MNQSDRFQFSMFNLLLAMLPLAVAFACLNYESRHGRNLLTAVVIVFGLTAACGTLAGGWRGMFRGLGATLAGIIIILCAVTLFLLSWAILSGK